MIPLASSPRSDTADWMAKAVVTMAIMAVSMDSSASMPVPLSRAVTDPPASSISSVIASTTEPNIRALSRIVSVQPMIGPRCRRNPRPSGVAYRAGADRWPARSGSSPAPRSRLASSLMASASSAAVSSSISARGHHRLAPHGCICWPHPIGEAQVRRPSPRSPTIRSR